MSEVENARKPNGYWTFERCKKEALKYESKKEFKKKSVSAYQASRKNKWLDEVCSHMKELRKHDGYWTFERCKEEAMKYESKNEFKKKSVSAYQVSWNNKWLDEVCAHMKDLVKLTGYWTFEQCKEEALKYESRSEFKLTSSGAYNSSKRNKWLDEIFAHMKPQGHYYKRFVYTIGCHDRKIVYIGLTLNLNNRLTQHRNKNKRIIKYFGNDFNYLWHTDNPIDAIEAQNLECELIGKYKNEGYKVLNQAKGGGLGGGIIKWTFERCKEEALKYENRKELETKSGGAYKASRKNKWLDEVCAHMKELRKHDGYWTFERCKEEALRYDSRKEFQIKSGGAYQASWNNKWLDEVFAHMPKRAKRKPKTIGKCCE